MVDVSLIIWDPNMFQDGLYECHCAFTGDNLLLVIDFWSGGQSCGTGPQPAGSEAISR